MFARVDANLFLMSRENVKASGVPESETRYPSASARTENMNHGSPTMSPKSRSISVQMYQFWRRQNNPLTKLFSYQYTKV